MKNYKSVAAALHDAVLPLLSLPEELQDEYITNIAVALYLDRNVLEVLRTIVQRANLNYDNES